MVWLCHSCCGAMAMVVGRVYVGVVSEFSGVVWWGEMSVVIMAWHMEWRSDVPPKGTEVVGKGGDIESCCKDGIGMVAGCGEGWIGAVGVGIVEGGRYSIAGIAG